MPSSTVVDLVTVTEALGATACFTCTTQSRGDLAPRDRIFTTGRWTAAHAFDANLEGWVVLFPVRHVLALDELDAAESGELGPLLVELSRSLRTVVGCTKTYTLLLAEKEGFHHLHFHVVPRKGDLPMAFRGSRIFGLLGNPDLAVVAAERMDAISLALRALVQAAVPHASS